MFSYRDQTGRNSTKIISRLVSFGCLLSIDPNITGLLYGEHHNILATIGVRYGKSGIGVQKL